MNAAPTTVWLLSALIEGCLDPLGAHADPRKALAQARDLAPSYGYEGDTRDLIVADGDEGPTGERELLLKDEDTCLFVVTPIGLTA